MVYSAGRCSQVVCDTSVVLATDTVVPNENHPMEEGGWDGLGRRVPIYLLSSVGHGVVQFFTKHKLV